MAKQQEAARISSAFQKRHLSRMAAYLKQVELIFDTYTKELAKLGIDATKGTRKFGDDMFAFSRFPQVNARASAILSVFRKKLLSCVVNGVNREWELANGLNDSLADLLFAGKELTEEEKHRFYRKNDDALAAFRERVSAGLNLSDRVWKYSNQYKTEIEMGLDCGIRDGVSAARMASELKAYLQFPDKLFRRVRDQHGNLVLSQAARAFHPTQGVYRSSFKNALRLTGTETNIAYRTADHERHKQLDFVLGIQIHLSNNHTLNGKPFRDICDDLQGMYPKEFKFVGWHPQCRCYVTSILMDDDEVDERRAARRAGKTLPESKNKIKDVPEAFKKYVEDRKEKLEAAPNPPYWYRDNPQFVGKVPPEPPHKTALEIAAERHANRTPEDIRKIQKEWNRRKLAIEIADDMRAQLHGIPDIDFSELDRLDRTADWKGLRAEASRLDDEYRLPLLDLRHVDDPMGAARKFGFQATMGVEAAIQKTFDRWTWDIDTRGSLEFLKGKLEREITVVSSSTAKSKYPTWEIAKAAYEKRLAEINERLARHDIRDSLEESIKILQSDGSRESLDLIEDFNAAFDNAIFLADVRAAGEAIVDRRMKIEAARRAAAAKANSGATGFMTDAEVVQAIADFNKTFGVSLSSADYSVENGFAKFGGNALPKIKKAQGSTSEDDRQIHAHWGSTYGGYVGTGNSFKINGAIRDVYHDGANALLDDVVTKKTPHATTVADRNGSILNDDDFKTIAALDKNIKQFQFPCSVQLVRNVRADAINPLFGVNVTGKTGSEAMAILKACGVTEITDAAYMSVSLNAQHNVFKDREFQFLISAPAGTHLYATNNVGESECILGRGTRLRIDGFEVFGGGKLRIFATLIQ